MAGLLAQGLARFLYTVAIGRWLGPEALGDVNTVLALAVYLSLFWPAALGVAGSRYIPSTSHGRANEQATIAYLKRSFWISTALLVPLGGIVAALLTADLLTGVAASALIGTYGAYTFVRGTLLGQDKVTRITVVDTISSIAALTLLITVITFDSSPLLLLPLSVGYLAFSLIGWPRTVTSSLDRALRGEINRFTAHSVVWLVATGGLLPTTMVFAQAFGSSRDAGIFAAAMTLATPANMIAQALSQVLVPFIAARAHEPEAMRALSLRLLGITVAGFTSTFGILFLLAPWLLQFFYGPEYAGGVVSMYGLLAGVYLSSCATVPISVLLATGRQRAVSIVSVATVVSATIVMAALAPFLQTLGILIGFILAPSISVVVLTGILFKRFSGVASSGTPRAPEQSP
jgi:O-antigen/teichoic acid export membrane protein